MDWVGVVGAFEGVVAAICEGFFAAGPADVVLCFGLFDFGYVWIILVSDDTPGLSK